MSAPMEVRTCPCGCGNTFKVLAGSSQKYAGLACDPEGASNAGWRRPHAERAAPTLVAPPARAEYEAGAPSGLTAKELSVAMGVPLFTIYKWVRLKLIPVNPGGGPRSNTFNLEACKAARAEYEAGKNAAWPKPRLEALIARTPKEIPPVEESFNVDDVEDVEDGNFDEIESGEDLESETPPHDLPEEEAVDEIEEETEEVTEEAQGEPTAVEVLVARRLVAKAAFMRDRGNPEVERELLWMAVDELGLSEAQV